MDDSFRVLSAQHVQVERVMINVRSKPSDLEKCEASHAKEVLPVPSPSTRICLSSQIMV